jgi:putative effector of murein hydrolase
MKQYQIGLYVGAVLAILVFAISQSLSQRYLLALLSGLIGPRFAVCAYHMFTKIGWADYSPLVGSVMMAELTLRRSSCPEPLV